jgi:hypothetical protein
MEVTFLTPAKRRGSQRRVAAGETLAPQSNDPEEKTMIESVVTLVWHTMVILSGMTVLVGAGLCAVHASNPEGREVVHRTAGA